jgi:sirohydrochlorin ferrochelatase
MRGMHRHRTDLMPGVRRELLSGSRLKSRGAKLRKVTAMSAEKTVKQDGAVLLIAHGSRREEANLDLARLADALRARDVFPVVEIAYLELAPPTILEGGRACVEKGARRVFLLPYFLSAGAHVTDDLERFRGQLASEHPHVGFTLCKPLSLHPLLVDIVVDRLREGQIAENA